MPYCAMVLSRRLQGRIAMAEWSRESVEAALTERGWLQSEREIQHARQFTLVDGTKVNCFHTGKVSVQGKDTPIKQEADTLFKDKATPSKPRRPSSPVTEQRASERKRVFIVYGHDLAARDELELLLRRLRLEPIILQNIPGGGETIIEKLEELTGADFACVLITPDDEGRKRVEGENLRPRARQNVVLELGMVLSRLGRRNVAILVKGKEIEPPSDIDGLIYIPFSDSVFNAKNTLAANLQKAGFNIRIEDLNT